MFASLQMPMYSNCQVVSYCIDNIGSMEIFILDRLYRFRWIVAKTEV
jgi:hypothetical protein